MNVYTLTGSTKSIMGTSIEAHDLSANAIVSPDAGQRVLSSLNNGIEKCERRYRPLRGLLRVRATKATSSQKKLQKNR
jgi:hypothetical protein